MPTELDVAKEAAAAGGRRLNHLFRSQLTVAGKDPEAAHNMVTNADVEAEQEIVETIRQSFPDHAMLGEESHQAEVDAEHLWVIDPLDGTTNFVHGIPHFAVSIAYYRQGVPQCGVVYNPAREDWFEAERGHGARYNGQRLQVTPSTELDQVLVGVGFYYDRGAMMSATLECIRELFHAQIHGIRRFGTAALDLAQVACGRYGAYFEYQLSPWDFAAGRLLVEEAGGRVTTCRGEPLRLEKTSLLASNGPLHEAVLDVVRRHHL